MCDFLCVTAFLLRGAALKMPSWSLLPPGYPGMGRTQHRSGPYMTCSQDSSAVAIDRRILPQEVQTCLAVEMGASVAFANFDTRPKHHLA